MHHWQKNQIGVQTSKKCFRLSNGTGSTPAGDDFALSRARCPLQHAVVRHVGDEQGAVVHLDQKRSRWMAGNFMYFVLPNLTRCCRVRISAKV